MPIQIFKINNLDCLCAINRPTNRITYVLYPMDILSDWIEDASTKYDTTIVVITGMDWQNDLTPWPAKGVPSGSPDFKGYATAFLKTLESTAMEIENRVGLATDASRCLVGVSLSGLFTLWQWVQTNFFQNIACMSGSFWYEGFCYWFAAQDLSHKKGFAYFLLGDKEPYSNVKAFNIVGANTEKIIEHLKSEGIRVQYDIVPGNHFQYPIERIDRAMQSLKQNSQSRKIPS